MEHHAPTPELKRWYAARRKAAALVSADPVYVPIFERVEREIASLEKQNDIISRAPPGVSECRYQSDGFAPPQPSEGHRFTR